MMLVVNHKSTGGLPDFLAIFRASDIPCDEMKTLFHDVCGLTHDAGNVPSRLEFLVGDSGSVIHSCTARVAGCRSDESSKRTVRAFRSSMGHPKSPNMSGNYLDPERPLTHRVPRHPLYLP